MGDRQKSNAISIGKRLRDFFYFLPEKLFVVWQLEISALSDCFYLRFQEYSILKTILFNTNKQYHLEILFFDLIAFLKFQTILNIFEKLISQTMEFCHSMFIRMASE